MSDDAFSDWFVRSWLGASGRVEVALAVDLGSQESQVRRPLYDAVGDLCDSLGHRAFRPYVHLGFDSEYYATPEEVYTTINQVVIPNARLVLACLDVLSFDVGMMMERARTSGRDILYFVERSNLRRARADLGRNGVAFPQALIKYQNRDDLLERLEPELRDYFAEGPATG